MANSNPLDMRKYFDKSNLIKICEDTCIQVRNRIQDYYKLRKLSFDETFNGECNRAALLFHIYFFKTLKDKQFEIFKNCTFGKNACPDYSMVNIHNVQALCAVDPLAQSDILIDFIHGEQKHSKDIKEEYWYIEHTWVKVQYKSTSIYCDPTCGQFKWLYPDIPDYYVSTKKPKWFYPDSDNPAWNNVATKVEN